MGTLFYHHGHWGNRLLYWDISENIHISELIPLVLAGDGLAQGPGPQVAHGDLPFLITMVIGTVSFCIGTFLKTFIFLKSSL